MENTKDYAALEQNEHVQQMATLKRQNADCEQALAAAREAEHRFQLFANSVEDYAFISFDRENRVTGWNRGAQRILGYDEASILGQTGRIFFTPEDRETGSDLRELALARAEGRAENERWHVRQDGSRFWGSGVMTPIYDEAGELQGYSKVMRDLTVRRETERQLQESEERFRLFVENVSDYALIPVDEQGNVSGWNPGAERIFGYTQTEILGQPVAIIFTPEDNAIRESERDLGRAVTDGRSEYERYMVRKDGSRFWARWVTTPMRDAHGHLRGFAKVLRDETERKQAQEERERLAALERRLLADQVQSKKEELDRTKEELRALAADLLTAQEEERRRIARELHDDLQQRLALLEVSVSRLRQDLPDNPAQIRAELNRLERELSAVSNEIRRLSHQLHPAILDDLGLRIALTRLAEDFQMNRAQPVRVEAENVPDGIPAFVSTALYRITQEALRNVAKHADGAAVTITLAGGPDRLHLAIQDTGPGFSPSDVRFRGGLGLISMHERATLAGGTLHLTSSPGRGTSIEVHVPLQKENE
jgi:PAS domain S-box-containing protein